MPTIVVARDSRPSLLRLNWCLWEDKMLKELKSICRQLDRPETAGDGIGELMGKKPSWVAIWMGLFAFSILAFFVTEAVFTRMGWGKPDGWGHGVFASAFMATFWVVIGRRAEKG
jgi:hypothetical protein